MYCSTRKQFEHSIGEGEYHFDEKDYFTTITYKRFGICHEIFTISEYNDPSGNSYSFEKKYFMPGRQEYTVGGRVQISTLTFLSHSISMHTVEPTKTEKLFFTLQAYICKSLGDKRNI